MSVDGSTVDWWNKNVNVDKILTGCRESHALVGPEFRFMFCRRACELSERISMDTLVVQYHDIPL